MKKLIIFLIFSALSTHLFAAEIRGRVIDSAKNPVSYASIYLKNQPQIGTITDENGRFTLEIPTTNDLLMVSFIGYETFSVATDRLFTDKSNLIQLKDQPITLDAVVVSAKTSKRQQRKQMKALLNEIWQQLQVDFPKTARKYRVVSDIRVFNEGEVLGFDEFVGDMVELPQFKGKNKRDSLQAKAEFTRFRLNEELEKGLKDFDYSSLKRKERKMISKTDFTQSEPLHAAVWLCDIRRLLGEIYTETNRWSVAERDALGQRLTHTRTFKLPGILDATLKTHITIDAQKRLQRLEQTADISLKIPFGYKLSEGELAALNMFLVGADVTDFQKFRLKTATGHIERNVVFVEQDGQMVVSEKSWAGRVTGADKNGQTVHFNQKTKSTVLSVQTSGVKPYTKAQLQQRAPRRKE